MLKALIQAANLPPDARLLDVGGGASALVDRPLEAGFTDLTVLDIVPTNLNAAKTRLGAVSSQVQWVATDITAWQPARQYDL